MAVSHINAHHIRELSADRHSDESPASTLERRLIEGERQIAAFASRGEDTSHLIDFWIELLHQYEQSVDAWSEAA